MYCKTFKELSKEELYAIAKLRQDVFIIEQNSIYCDLDDYDQTAMHYLDFDSASKLIVYARYRLESRSRQVKIERVVLDKNVRGKGLGRHLINMMLNDITRHLPSLTIILSSQVEASPFYSSLGFVAQGDTYDDGGIDHIQMSYQPEKNAS